MKFAICNEMFGSAPLVDTFSTVRQLGYTGIEIAPFTLIPEGLPVDVKHVDPARRREVRAQAEDAGLTVVGLHWLLAKTEGFYLTSPESQTRSRTADYFRALTDLCADLGGTLMVLGSPQQRNLLPGVSYDDAEKYAAEVLREVMPTCAERGVTIALEPLGPAEGDFMLTAESAIELAKLVDSSHCKLHLDVKAMSSEPRPIPEVIHASRDWVVHFHANDPNLLGPGMGEVRYEPIFRALAEIQYSGWVSLEVFKYEPSPEEIACQSIEYMQQVLRSI